MAAVWIDAELCIGCGACVDVCQPGAITLVSGKAQVNRELCTGCEVCIEVCPTQAIQRVLTGEIVPATAPAGAVQQAETVKPAPVTVKQAATAVAATTGVSLVLRFLQTLADAIGRWLTSASRPATGKSPDTSARSGTRLQQRGRQVRHRQRGR